MDDVISFPNSLLDDHEIIENLARFAEGLLSKEAVKKKHRLADEVWSALGENDRLVELVEDAKLRRIRTGQVKRERAQMEIVDAPPILGGIMRDPNANERHRIDSIKVLDQLADNGPQTAAAAAAMFHIVINLGSDANGKEVIEEYCKPITVGIDDGDTNVAPQDVIAAVTMNKTKDGDSGGHL